eukprot:GCRY01001954.1.p1 GENE.GCRY01001954.1~~GCRY01001954.1.p1  ORF type:complete len:266 (+),score=43.77 GCRY01001954.1:129-926(+)
MRINVLPVEVLADQHLVAEWNELRMLAPTFRRSFHSKKGIDVSKIGAEYTLNTGHGYFFYDKFLYVAKRFQQIHDEMKKRGYEPKNKLLDFSGVPVQFFNDYIPDIKAQMVNFERIQIRVNKKPDWYNFRKEPGMKWETFFKVMKLDLEKGLCCHHQQSKRKTKKKASSTANTSTKPKMLKRKLTDEFNVTFDSLSCDKPGVIFTSPNKESLQILKQHLGANTPQYSFEMRAPEPPKKRRKTADGTAPSDGAAHDRPYVQILIDF